MNLIRLPHHEHPAPPYHELRQKIVLDSGSRNIGAVENLYVDDDRNLQFFDVMTSGLLGLGKKHHLIPAEAIADESTGSITLGVDQGTVQGAPPLSGPARRAGRRAPARHPRALRLRLEDARTSENTTTKHSGK